ncbi:AMP-binding protein [Sporosarcina sp. E16_3]|uniref:class I adenylate-forming enzyme family protein n=1 Tax=Sporosarcina sp. E16_3 TaxID=2789293 RepID=UPI001A92E37D|nr:AMP-binding protein [Sporosarcina sp. E16_3]MBO0603457.1 AMP-binding protein [Sporosarcina sp. E16_3]
MLTHGNTTVYTLLKEQASKYKNKSFVLYEDENISYDDMLKRVNQMAQWLLKKGIKKEDTVAVFLSNSPLFYEVWYACGAIGAILLPINTASTPTELDYFLEHSESKGLIYEENLLNEKHITITENRSLSFTQVWNDSWEFEKSILPHESLQMDVTANDTACIMYTSGTTAKPKGVLITHENYLFAGHSSVLYQQLTSDDRYLIFLPLFHANSQYYTSMATLVVGGTIVLLKRFSSSTFWDAIDRYQPTVSSLVATVIKILLECPEHPAERRHSIRQAGYGLLVTSSDLASFQTRFGIKLFQWYGLTESITTNIVTPLYEEMPIDPVTGITAIGKAGMGQEIRIINERGEDVPPKVVGEIIIKSPSLMKGYFKNPTASIQTLQNGWLYTGDNGFYNESGFIWFVDRNKDMIKRAGENISSLEVENVLSDHPAVQDCAVVGEPDPLREEAVVAYIKLYDGKKADSDSLFNFCKERLSIFKIPTEFRFLNDFPRTSIGKIQKNLLREK